MRCAGCGVGQGRRAPVHARASQNQLSSEKTHMVWKTFFRVFAERSPTPYFYNEISPSRGPSFHNFDSKLTELHFWPKRGQWDPMWSESDSIWIKFDPNWVKLGPNEAQSIFTPARTCGVARCVHMSASAWPGRAANDRRGACMSKSRETPDQPPKRTLCYA